MKPSNPSGTLRGAAPRIILSGVGLALAMPPTSIYPLAWIALVPLIDQWRRTNSPRTAWLEASTALLVLYASAGYWVLKHPIWESALASLGAGLLLPLFQAVPFAAAVPIRKKRGLAAGITSLAVLSLVCEFLLLRSPLALPWFLLGHSQADALLFNQFIDLTGVLGLSLWIWLLNGAAFVAVRTPGSRRALAGLVFTTSLVGALAYGNARHADLRPAGDLSIGVVQPALSPAVWADGDSDRRMNRLFALSDSLLASEPETPPAMVVWPETAVPRTETPRERRELYEILHTWTAAANTTLITGTIRPARSGSASNNLPYNSAAIFHGDRSVDHYDKRVLVPFAEGIPGARYWSTLNTLQIDAGGVPGYQKGKGPGYLSMADASFAVGICFESLFGYLSHEALQRGASFILILAQNGWWGDSPGPRQHQSFTRLRAIESRRAVVLASASGTTSLIRADGRIARELGWMAPTAARFEVPVHRLNTWYSRFGDVIGWAAVMLTLCGGSVAVIQLLFRRYG